MYVTKSSIIQVLLQSSSISQDENSKPEAVQLSEMAADLEGERPGILVRLLTPSEAEISHCTDHHPFFPITILHARGRGAASKGVPEMGLHNASVWGRENPGSLLLWYHLKTQFQLRSGESG